MAFITHYRGSLREYAGVFDVSMLLHEITPEEYLTRQYPPFLWEKFAQQARADRDSEWATIQAATQPGDTLWLWRRVEEQDRTDGSLAEWGGLALKRAGKVIRVWLVWKES